MMRKLGCTLEAGTPDTVESQERTWGYLNSGSSPPPPPPHLEDRRAFKFIFLQFPTPKLNGPVLTNPGRSFHIYKTSLLS